MGANKKFFLFNPIWTEFLDRDDLPRQLRESDGVIIEEGYWINRRGMALMTSTMTPETNNDDDDDGVNDGSGIRAVVCLCHGYMDNVSFLKRIQFQRFFRRNIAVCIIEYEGHGRSDGINALAAHNYFRHVTREKFPNVKRVFLMGESMGEAVAYDIMSRHRDSYDGAIFAAPMVKILVTPPPFVVALFERIVGHSIPEPPSRGNMPRLSFKDKDKMRLALMVPTKYGRKPRFATARELLNATLEDMVTDPRMSEMLYNESCSSDKTIKLYRGMYHNLTTGETDENIDIVFNDAISWVTDRSKS
ncbi:hypothetical protein ACHAXA_009156 [Cyclostephanos tholiformis]|uniref:Serine aminopeptidase S33 domain-containing protein n=1 Tax=Cyclostephanos tholiformis TaxID=382380 RepID=A0ABD3R8Q0_9STRA